MTDMLYVAASGARQIADAQTANANNLANVSTIGFQADLAAFQSMEVYGDGYPTQVHAMPGSLGVDHTRGALQTTGRDLDIAVNGRGYIGIQARDGSEAYTRAGDMHITGTGQLVTGVGHPVLGDGGPIVIPPFEKIEIGVDGTVSFQPVGQSAKTLAVIDRIKLVDPPLSELEKGADGLIRLKDESQAVADANVKLLSGVLESSNVNAVEAMVNMIELARKFEMQVKLMNLAEENDSASAELMKIS